MNWKDTVMTRHDIKEYTFGDKVWAMIRKLLKDQAEVSFKLGKTLGVAETMKPALKAMEDMKKAAIKEVVEYIEQEKSTAYIFEGEYAYGTKIDNQLFLDLDDWESQKKEWEI